MLHNSTVAERFTWPKACRATVIKVLDIIGAAKVRLFFYFTKLFLLAKLFIRLFAPICTYILHLRKFFSGFPGTK